MFLDHLATDIEHLERLNQLLGSGQVSQFGIEGCEKMRPLASFLITPSVDLSQLAEQHQRDMPYLIQYFVNSLGRDAASCADLMSYLLFTSAYTSALTEIGYNDANQRIDEIESFLYSSDDGRIENPRVRAVGTGKPGQASSLAKRSSNSVRSRG
jgi:NTE family protein